MLAQLLQRWNAIREGYWFLPTVMALAAAGLSLLTTWVDSRLGMA